MKILVGIDDSLYSRAAVEFVSRLRWPPTTKAFVASAVPFAVHAYSEVYVPASASNEELMQEVARTHQDLVSQAEGELRDAGIATEGRVLRGDPREALVQMAQDEKVDLVVVGSHGRSGVAKLLMGSVANHVVTHAPCSVLVVKSGRRGK